MTLSKKTTKRPWGFFKILSSSKKFKIKLIKVNPNSKLSYQSHKFRSEHWVILEGNAQIIINGKKHIRKKNQNIFIARNSKHRIINLSKKNNLFFIEVQTGTSFSEKDIIRYEDIYGRI